MFQFTQAMHYSDTWISVCCCGGTSAGLRGALQHFPRPSAALFPPSLPFLSFPFPIFLLFRDSITPHSSSLSLFLVLMRSLITASPLCSPSLSLSLSHTHTHTHTHTPSLKFFLLSPQYFTFGGHPFSLLRSLFLHLPCSFLLCVCHFLCWIFNRYLCLHIHMK